MPDVTSAAPPPARGAWRRAGRWVGVALSFLVPALAAAGPQAVAPEAPSPAAAPAAKALSFTTPAGALLLSVLPAKTTEFESLMALFARALAASPDAQKKALGEGWTLYRAGEPAPGGANVLYVVVIDPALPEADYSWQTILSTIVAAFPDKEQEVFEQGTSVHAGPMNKLTLTRVGASP